MTNTYQHINHVAIDLETLGLQADAVLLQIGLAFVDFDGQIRTFSSHASVGSQPERVVDPGTVEWWEKQGRKNPEVYRQVVEHAYSDEAPTLQEALQATTGWMLDNCRGFTTWVWGNGAAFDLGKLDHAYASYDAEPPWHFRNERDMRTLQSIAALAGLDLRWEVDRRDGEHHNAASDASYQALRISRLFSGIEHRLTH